MAATNISRQNSEAAAIGTPNDASMSSQAFPAFRRFALF
jgi:hypothetical protein